MKNIAVVCGGDSGEYDISVQSGKVVAGRLDASKYKVFVIIIQKHHWYFKDDSGQSFAIDKNDFSLPLPNKTIRFDAVFNAIHGVPGEDGRLTGYFDMLNMPYTSSNQACTSLSFNKDFCKRVVASFGVTVATAVLLRKNEPINAELIIGQTGLPAFVKPNNSGSSVGITKVKTADALLPAIEYAFEHDTEILVETFLEGVELGCSVMQTKKRGLIVFPLTEIVSKKEFFDYEAKYTPGMADEITPARIDEADETAVSHLASLLYKKLGLSGFVRFDFILSAEKDIYFLEVNTVPGISPASILPQQSEVMGISLTELFGMALENVLDD
jgi:D-alanine-D-alanine ligase